MRWAVHGVLLFALLACSAPPVDPRLRCPDSDENDPPRAAQVMERLRSTAEGERLFSRRPQFSAICFGAHRPSVVRSDGVVLLDSSLSQGEGAARLAHLLLHRAGASPYPAPLPEGADCDQVVEQALRAEAKALVLECAVRRRLGVVATNHAFEFETSLASSEDPEQEVFEYLVAHPAGGPGIDALGASYRTRCEREMAARERRGR